jgi:hypothetical protein
MPLLFHLIPVGKRGIFNVEIDVPTIYRVVAEMGNATLYYGLVLGCRTFKAIVLCEFGQITGHNHQRIIAVGIKIQPTLWIRAEIRMVTGPLGAWAVMDTKDQVPIKSLVACGAGCWASIEVVSPIAIIGEMIQMERMIYSSLTVAATPVTSI